MRNFIFSSYIGPVFVRIIPPFGRPSCAVADLATAMDPTDLIEATDGIAPLSSSSTVVPMARAMETLGSLVPCNPDELFSATRFASMFSDVAYEFHSKYALSRRSGSSGGSYTSDLLDDLAIARGGDSLLVVERITDWALARDLTSLALRVLGHLAPGKETPMEDSCFVAYDNSYHIQLADTPLLDLLADEKGRFGGEDGVHLYDDRSLSIDAQIGGQRAAAAKFLRALQAAGMRFPLKGDDAGAEGWEFTDDFSSPNPHLKCRGRSTLSQLLFDAIYHEDARITFCKVCGNAILARKGRGRPRDYCSEICRDMWNDMFANGKS